jgi:hypothetical protein
MTVSKNCAVTEKKIKTSDRFPLILEHEWIRWISHRATISRTSLCFRMQPIAPKRSSSSRDQRHPQEEGIFVSQAPIKNMWGWWGFGMLFGPRLVGALVRPPHRSGSVHEIILTRKGFLQKGDIDGVERSIWRPALDRRGGRCTPPSRHTERIIGMMIYLSPLRHLEEWITMEKKENRMITRAEGDLNDAERCDGMTFGERSFSLERQPWKPASH